MRVRVGVDALWVRPLDAVLIDSTGPADAKSLKLVEPGSVLLFTKS